MDSIIIIQQAVVKEFQGKRISLSQSSKIITQVPELERLKQLIIYRNQTRQEPKLLNKSTGNKKILTLKQVQESAERDLA